jgi:4-hydroxyphenylpyruvate dioxygenase-like putative hemolysin
MIYGPASDRSRVSDARPQSKYLESFKEFPPRAKAASFTVSDAMDKITTAQPGQN